MKARTNRIVRQLLNVTSDRADQLLSQCDGELKTALIVGRTGVTPGESRRQLAETGGRIAVVLDRHRATIQYPDHVLGIDGGGTHTHAILAQFANRTIRTIGRGRAGSANVKSTSIATAFAQINRAVTEAFAVAGLPCGAVGAACLGLAGAGRPDDQAAVRAWAEQNRLATSIEVVGDVALPIALLPEHCGIVIVAGTGSCVWGQAADGRTSRAGGWGPIMGDEGSGYGIAVSALQAITRAADGRTRSTSLTERLLGRMNLAEPTRLVAAIHGGKWDRAKLAMLAADVIRAADEGDSIAKEIVGHHVQELADSVAAVVRRLGMARDGLALALAGGLLTRAPTYRDRLLVDLGNRGLHPGHVIEVSEPADGAVRRAAAMLTSR